jgi:hypothetical protein
MCDDNDTDSNDEKKKKNRGGSRIRIQTRETQWQCHPMIGFTGCTLISPFFVVVGKRRGRAKKIDPALRGIHKNNLHRNQRRAKTSCSGEW